MPGSETSSRNLLRHALATLAYRGGKTLRGAPESFAGFEAAAGTRTPLAILAHLGDLLDWALSQAQGGNQWRPIPPSGWNAGVQRFFRSLEALDAHLASEAPLGTSAEKLFQGPVADALTHVGQLALLRRMAGAPVRGENYAVADIAVGRVGPEQAPPRREFE
jgi:hypothetical protein